MRDRIRDFRDRLPAFSPGPSMAAGLAKWVEALLILLLVVQFARLAWAMVTPLGMLGDWQARQPVLLPAAARAALFRSFDPFTRGQSAESGGGQVTGLALQLFGTRLNEGSGQGSAIIATPDGVQSSFAVGDEIVPGATLKEVAYDHVVIDRGGRSETLFLDQSAGVDEASAGAPEGGQGDAGAGSQPLTPSLVQRDIAFTPRSEGGRISGIVVSPKGDGAGFAAAGFKSGDIITQINGGPITSAGDIQSMQAQLRPGARLSLMVERGAATVPISITLSGEQ